MIRTALKSGLVSCHDCGLLCRAGKKGSSMFCPRCHARLHERKPRSISRTWALVLAACIMYVPANAFPIMRTSAFGASQSDTILSGVIYFIKTGSWHIALVIFVASVFVPFLKLLILFLLLISVQFKSSWRPVDRTRLYRLTEVVGRWSMVDIFVVTLMVAVVNLGTMADVDPGPAALYFAAVVVLTMFAAKSFDPRLIWDYESMDDE